MDLKQRFEPQRGSSRRRFPEIDWLRGMAAIAMVFYHASWNAWFLDLLPLNPLSPPGRTIAALIASTFLLIVGVCFHLGFSRHGYSNYRAIWHRHSKRAIRLGAIAMGITTAVHFTIDGEILFGILHLIAVSTMVVPMMAHAPRLSGPLGVLLIGLGIWSRTWSTTSLWLLPLGGRAYPIYMLDYYPLFPWLGVVLLGVALGRFLYPEGEARYPVRSPETRWLAPMLEALAFCGRHALTIYVVHQPILFGLMQTMRN